ncbi:MAG: 6-carboxytetrahydropterin synthase QueD [Deltaproteobacteria bacterium]|nr:6-carboxytetrahydropterin synthase QueD [Deltaproteobacteria bacterium]
MYELKIITQFAAAHRLLNFQGKCEQLHGHNWKVEVFVRADRLDSAGLVRDFGDIKAVTQEVLNGFDHHYLNELIPFQQDNPSSEHIARYLFQELSRRLNDDRARVSKISVWESDSACATYWGE